MMIKFEVPGECIAKGRPRRGAGGIWYTPKSTKDYEREVGWHARIAMKGKNPFTEAVSVQIDIIEPIPPSWPSWKRKKAINQDIFPTSGDLDNKIKGLLDGMNGIVYLDDKQVRSIEAKKSYGIEPRATVIVKADSQVVVR